MMMRFFKICIHNVTLTCRANLFLSHEESFGGKFGSMKIWFSISQRLRQWWSGNRGVNHFLEISVNPYEKSEIPYSECWCDLPLSGNMTIWVTIQYSINLKISISMWMNVICVRNYNTPYTCTIEHTHAMVHNASGGLSSTSTSSSTSFTSENHFVNVQRITLPVVKFESVAQTDGSTHSWTDKYRHTYIHTHIQRHRKTEWDTVGYIATQCHGETDRYTETQSHPDTHTHTNSPTHTDRNTHPETDIHTHTDPHTDRHTQTQTHTLTQPHTHTDTHTQTHTHSHTGRLQHPSYLEDIWQRDSLSPFILHGER